MPRLALILGSTRPGRAGLAIARWFEERARAHGRFEVDFVDLAEVALPFVDEPEHPRFGRYQHEHTWAWSRRISAADAFVLVTPEYNHGAPPALVNAIDYLVKEWAYKPAALVSYGGVSGGTRAAQILKLMLMGLRVPVISEAVVLPFVPQHLQDGRFHAPEASEKAVPPLLDELLRWTEALRPLRG
jgi:NAD(P)H-dependent FMN reductase